MSAVGALSPSEEDIHCEGAARALGGTGRRGCRLEMVQSGAGLGLPSRRQRAGVLPTTAWNARDMCD